MTGANQQLVAAFEDLGLGPEDIAEQFGYDVAAVKSILFQCSSMYRGSCKQDSKLQYTDEECERALEIIKDTAYGADDEHLRFKAACRMIDEKKGRLDVQKALSGLGSLNIVSFNIQMKKALEAVQRVNAPKTILLEESVKEV